MSRVSVFMEPLHMTIDTSVLRSSGEGSEGKDSKASRAADTSTSGLVFLFLLERALASGRARGPNSCSMTHHMGSKM